MLLKARLIFQSYVPEKLEKGMWFMAITKDSKVVYEMNYVPWDAEDYIQLNGYPVQPYIVYQGNPNLPDETQVIAHPYEIGWWDEGEHTDDLYDITLKEINNIISIDDGWLFIECEEVYIDDDECQEDCSELVPVTYNKKVVLSYYDEELNNPEYMFEDDEEWDVDDDPEHDSAGFTIEDR